ncbi:hypothetical protein ACOQFV_24595 [Nocardiopsis changdeensis]|uniref:Toxin-antitoxin system n=1 Tax=Nocardiopsis changdeensis TaxID=2831969 RepID=A0A975KQF8_9ACTN|nr:MULTISPECIES: hypothetical protein [Nocardiopsis]QUX26429.1 hypothetical protein KGD84_32545 [Nocardiopsis changdeensis]QYX40701.1 hypothetical protein K1J57_32395 [Nocardiopsis sp. MT53]
MSTSGKRGRGRPAKGDRHKRTIRFPRIVDDALQAAAQDAGYATVQDYVVAVMTGVVEPYMPSQDSEKGRLMTA